MQATPGFNFAAISTEQLKVMMKNKDLAPMIPAIQAELNDRNKPKATLVVEVLKNFTAKAIMNKNEPTGNYRIQGRVIAAKLANPGPNDEVTFGFGDFKEVANIQIFLIVPEEQLDQLDSSISTHVTCEVAMTVNPTVEGAHFVLSAGTINELRSVYVPEENRNRSQQVWVGPKGEEYLGKEPPAGYTPVKVASYGNISVVEILEVNPVNLALSNSVIPEDKAAWIKAANEQARRTTDANLLAYQAKQQANINLASNPAVQDAAGSLETKEQSDVDIKI